MINLLGYQSTSNIKQNKIISIIIVINVVGERTIIGSMSSYVEQAKENIIDATNFSAFCGKKYKYRS